MGLKTDPSRANVHGRIAGVSTILKLPLVRFGLRRIPNDHIERPFCNSIYLKGERFLSEDTSFYERAPSPDLMKLLAKGGFLAPLGCLKGRKAAGL